MRPEWLEIDPGRETPAAGRMETVAAARRSLPFEFAAVGRILRDNVRRRQSSNQTRAVLALLTLAPFGSLWLCKKQRGRLKVIRVRQQRLAHSAPAFYVLLWSSGCLCTFNHAGGIAAYQCARPGCKLRAHDRGNEFAQHTRLHFKDGRIVIPVPTRTADNCEARALTLTRGVPTGIVTSDAQGGTSPSSSFKIQFVIVVSLLWLARCRPQAAHRFLWPLSSGY